MEGRMDGGTEGGGERMEGGRVGGTMDGGREGQKGWVMSRGMEGQMDRCVHKQLWTLILHIGQSSEVKSCQTGTSGSFSHVNVCLAPHEPVSWSVWTNEQRAGRLTCIHGNGPVPKKVSDTYRIRPTITEPTPVPSQSSSRYLYRTRGPVGRHIDGLLKFFGDCFTETEKVYVRGSPPADSRATDT